MGSLSKASLEQFAEEGYLVVEGLLDQKLDIEPLVQEYATLLDGLAQEWVAQGKLSQTYEELPFNQRLMQIIAESGQAYYQSIDISLPQADISETTPLHTGPAIFNLLRSPRLLDAVESIIGPEIYSNPVQHVRIKAPERSLSHDTAHNALTVNTPWHQDMGVIDDEADDSMILTVWLPMTQATTENGCLLVSPGSHKGELALHCPSDKGAMIPDHALNPKQIPVPMQPGDVLFMTSKTMHSSLPNLSDDIRWSFDLRYNPIGQPTGRPWFPGFVARSRNQPESELHDAEAWAQLWRETRRSLALAENPAFNRWRADHPGCA